VASSGNSMGSSRKIRAAPNGCFYTGTGHRSTLDPDISPQRQNTTRLPDTQLGHPTRRFPHRCRHCQHCQRRWFRRRRPIHCRRQVRWTAFRFRRMRRSARPGRAPTEASDSCQTESAFSGTLQPLCRLRGCAPGSGWHKAPAQAIFTYAGHGQSNAFWSSHYNTWMFVYGGEGTLRYCMAPHPEFDPSGKTLLVTWTDSNVIHGVRIKWQ
jgi:hypothetical protein